MKRLRILQMFVTACSVLTAASTACAQMSTLDQINRKIHDEYGLVGQWTITKMEVSKSMTMMGATPAAQAGYDLGSSLVEGSFEIQPTGTIVGRGRAAYRLRVSAGSSAKFPLPLGLGVLANAMTIGGLATLAPEEDGVRSFSITGQADLVGRTISLKAFQPAGSPLKLIIQPGPSQQGVALWPPMTNVGAPVVAEGASLVLRAAGTVGGIKVAIEARKYIDVEHLLRLFETALSSCGCGTKPAVTAAPPRHLRGVTKVSLPVSAP